MAGKDILYNLAANNFSGVDYNKSSSNFSFAPGGGFGQTLGMRSIGGGMTNEHGSINRSSTMQYDEYYKALKDDPYLDTLVDCLFTPVLEIIDTAGQHIQVEGHKDSEGNYLINKDAIIIINKFFKECDLKGFIVDHLRDFITRGSFYAYIDYTNKRIADVIDPFNFYIIKGSNGTEWIKPDPKVEGASAYGNVSSMSQGSLTSDMESNLLAAEQFVYYYYDLEDVKSYSKIGSMSGISSFYEKAKHMFVDGDSKQSNQSLTRGVQDQLDALLCMCKVFRPSSIFDSHLKSLLTLAVKKFIHSNKEMLDVMRSELIAINFHDNIDNEKAMEIVARINESLNQHNPEFLRSFERPSAILGTVIDKLINQLKVVPSNDAMSDMGVVPQPDYKSVLPDLAESIARDESNIASNVGIPQELVTGTSNRWEAISHNDKFLLKVKSILVSIENFIKTTACNAYYLHTNENYWKNKKWAKGQRIDDYKDEDEFKSFGNRIDAAEIVFSFNADDLMESNVSKSKALIIGEKLTTIASILDNVNSICAMPGVRRMEFNRYVKDKFEILAGDDYDFLDLEETTEPEYQFDPETQAWYDAAGNQVDESEVPPAYLQGMDQQGMAYFSNRFVRGANAIR